MSGSVLYMLNHGLSTGALFLMIGMMYERYHTRNMDEIGGLAPRCPSGRSSWSSSSMASVGLPGLNGFVSEFLCTMGAFHQLRPWTDEGVNTMAGATWASARPVVRRRSPAPGSSSPRSICST
jgi:NADH-quinone oxidoreductase subunit M